jgi:outer membrane protein OmpA-like peptidoglycan-associated protein
MPRPSFAKGKSMRRLFSVLISILIAVAATPFASLAYAEDGDVPGSQDYPGIGRFAGSLITGYDAKDFDATRLQTAPFSDGQATGDMRPEGRVTRIAYRTGPGPSILEVFRNFETQLKEAGFEMLLSCAVDDCGGIPFSEALDVLPIPLMWVDGFTYRYYAGRKASDGRETFATVLVSQNNDAITAQLVVTEVGEIADKMIDAAAMAKGLGETGHIALYGIYFDTDRAELKPESRPTLDEIASLLQGQPDMKVIIVGHTDSQGGYDYNMDLSKRRAAAVAAELAAAYQIPAERLQTAGVGYLAPVGSNASDSGRALNRRVELVAP